MYLSATTTISGTILVSESDTLPGFFFIQSSTGGFTLGISRAEAIELAAKLVAVASEPATESVHD